MKREIRYSPQARADLLRLYAFLLDKDPRSAQRALSAIVETVAELGRFPHTGRRMPDHEMQLRERFIRFGRSGYLALYRLGSDDVVTILAIRHQREDDYR